jgi:type I restriction enzyme M protein
LATPEERVRQEYLRQLVNSYGYSLGQIEEEVSVTGRGSGDARADFLVWRSPSARAASDHAMIVVETKADNVRIALPDYRQGAHYAQYEHAQFFVTHNNRETRYWRIDASRRMPNFEEIEDVPKASATDREIEDLFKRLKTFEEEEFARLLEQCHDVIRNREKKDPAAAFDEIAKLLFIKVAVERRMQAGGQRRNVFTADYIDELSVVSPDPMSMLFEQTKQIYRADRLFTEGDTVNLRPATVREIVRLLERYNLSDTSEDIKGIAFETFLGRTFRGEIGQFFTPRSIVEFMVRMVEPREGDVVCDPAAGSGGFLIRFFDLVRQQIFADVDATYRAYAAELTDVPAEEGAALLSARYDELQRDLDPERKGSRVYGLANDCIFGCDANDRMARTSKMNMIMHGDGHGGVHHHDGLINVDGIFEERFDIVLTNPPFGSTVDELDVVAIDDVAASDELVDRYVSLFGPRYAEMRDELQSSVGKPIASMYELARRDTARTEVLFLERCLKLLKPGGRLAIVLPDGVLNNPSLGYVRDWVEQRAYLRAVVSLPPDTFLSAGASVKASLVFLQKFSSVESAQYGAAMALAGAQADGVEAPVGRGRRSRALKGFDYPVFMFDATKVGITPTGAKDSNELFPNPDWSGPTAFELYQEFRRDPTPFMAEPT